MDVNVMMCTITPGWIHCEQTKAEKSCAFTAPIMQSLLCEKG